ncbi:MAG: hypothetical protein J6J43_07715 [Oscillospiraceae bacterium]|nr:hypothetical protein [Oscillospiraceae bacterium]
MGLLDVLFGSGDTSEDENSSLSSTIASSRGRKILYQCRYCSYRSERYASQGAPLPGVNNCPRHPRGTHKGPHSWMRTYL